MEAECIKQFEVHLLFETCNHAKHFGAAIEAAFRIANAHNLIPTDFINFPHGDEGTSDEPFVWMEFTTGSKEAGDKAAEEFWEEVPDVFTTSCNCQCDVCLEERRLDAATLVKESQVIQ